MALDVELAEVRDFLAGHEPFSGLPAAVLTSLPGRMAVEYFRRGSELIGRGEENHHLYVLRSGACDVHDAQGTLVDRGGAGASFGSITLTQGNPSTFSVTAIEDSLALLLAEDDFHALCREHPEFDAFYDAQRRSRMQGAVAELQVSASGSAILKTRVRDLLGARRGLRRRRHDRAGGGGGHGARGGVLAARHGRASGSPASSPTATCAPGSSPPGSTRPSRSPR